MTLAAALRARVSAAFTLEVDLSAPPGFTIVFGASGSGKSTLLRCIAGLTTPQEGRIAIGEQTLFDSAAGVRLAPEARRVGYVFQQLALFPHLTVEGNLRYGLHRLPERDVRDRVARVADSFRIAHLLDRRPARISGGERQRTALARALVTDPAALLLDEPLSALDHRTQSHIIDDLRRWNAERRIPILYVTHSHREAFALGERAIVLDGGRVVATGTPQQVLHAPASELLAQLAGFENIIGARVRAASIDGGTMTCRVDDAALDLEVPLVAGAATDAAVRLAIRAGDILLATEPPRGLSVRNVVPGVVRTLRRAGTTVVAHVDAGVPFEVHLTPHAETALGLTGGLKVWLVIKTHSCHPVALSGATAQGHGRTDR
ncbi:MAG: molybdenum ABC transporter ATP-binding protein [Vicinamibacterales bacterium]